MAIRCAQPRWNVTGTASAVALGPMLRYARTQGVAIERILAGIGLTQADLDVYDLRIPATSYCTAWVAAAGQTRDETFGLHAAENAEVGAFDVLDYALYFSSSLGEALDRILRFHSLIYDAVSFRVTTEGATVRLQRIGRTPPVESESALAVLVNRARELTGTQTQPHEVRFAHAAHAATRPYEAFFRCPVRFDCAASEIVFPSSELGLRVLSGNSGVNRILDRYMRTLLERLPTSDSPVERARASIARVLVSGRPTLEATARDLHVSPRTLQRRLAEHDTTHAELLDSVRRELGEKLVREGRLSITEITFLLGFGDLSGFRRAYKRWTGSAPSRGRRAGRETRHT